MIPAHINKPITQPISIPAIGAGRTRGLDSSVRVIPINLTDVAVFMVSNSSLPGIEVKFGPQTSNRGGIITDAKIDSNIPQFTAFYNLNTWIFLNYRKLVQKQGKGLGLGGREDRRSRAIL